MSGQVIICGTKFPIDAPLVNFEDNGWDHTVLGCVLKARTDCANTGGKPYSDKAKNRGLFRYGSRPALRRYGKEAGNIPLEAAKAVIKQFVIHHDGMYSAESCFAVLHDERGLSCHFLVDNNGTIYQTLDLALCGFHAAEFNPNSIGVELCNRGDAKEFWNYYNKKDGSGEWDTKRYPDLRDKKPIKIHGSKILAWDFTKPQYESMRKLAKGLAKLLPNLPIEYPQEAPGVPSWTDIANAKSFSGYIGHYHLTRRKWDPGPFDFKGFCDGLRGTLSFPMWTGKKDDIDPKQKPEIPEGVEELRKRSQALIDANEQRAEGGFFPVGPWGDARLWHGGIHLPGPEGATAPAPVFAPFPGRVVAARMGKDSPTGSVNFVLLRHSMSVGKSHAKFYSLYMHLHDELKEAKPLPAWMTKDGKDGWMAKPDKEKKGGVVLLDEPVEAGEVIGRIGIAGPVVDGDDLRRPQMHFEIFSDQLLFTEFDGEKWSPVDGADGGRFCDQDQINRTIDEDKDKKLSRRELVTFYAGSGDRAALRHVVTYHVSEWTDSPSWNNALRMQPDFRKDSSGKDVKPEDIDLMIEEQIAPGLWWNDVVADHTNIPRDGYVYHYHPITFIEWVNTKILETAADPSMQAEVINEEDTAKVEGMTADADEGSEGDQDLMVSDADLDDGASEAVIELENLVEGYAGEPEEMQ